MHNNVAYELTVFGGAGAAGVILAFLYDLFRLKRRFWKTRPLLVNIEDCLFWICAAVILFLSSYILSSGETRPYFFAGAVLGAISYWSILSKPTLWLLTTIIRILLWPFKEILKFLRPIFHVLMIKLRKITGKAKNRIALEGYRARVSFIRLRNAFVKK